MAERSGTLDDRYELRRVLGQGAEGTVFEATHVFTGQRFAVKVAASPLPPGATDAQPPAILASVIDTMPG